MFICKVCGKCVSTIKSPQLGGSGLMLLQKLGKDGESTGDLLVAVDLIGCSIDEVVLVTTGSGARNAIGNQQGPSDMAIVGIVDAYDYNSKNVTGGNNNEI